MGKFAKVPSAQGVQQIFFHCALDKRVVLYFLQCVPFDGVVDQLVHTEKIIIGDIFSAIYSLTTKKCFWLHF